MSANGVNDDIDLRVITDEQLKELDALANKAEEAAKKVDEKKKKIQKDIKEISDEQKKLIGGPAQDINKFSSKRTLPLNAAFGENALGFDFSKSPIMGGKTSNFPSDLLDKLEQMVEQKTKQQLDQFEHEHGEILTDGSIKDFKKDLTFAEQTAEEALAKAQKAESDFGKFESKYAQTLGVLRNPFGFLGGQVGGMLGKAGLAGLVLMFGQEVTSDIFDLIKSWFDTPGGLFDIRKRIKDAIYTIGDLHEQLQIRNGNVFFTDNTNLYQHSPYHSNTENISQYQMRYVYSSRYD